MSKPIATLILNRNLPAVADGLYEHFERFDGDLTDIYVIESGSDQGNLSRYYSFWADWPEAIGDGLRYGRGFNYGLTRLLEEGQYEKYDYFFLVCNDTVFPETSVLAPLYQEVEQYQKIGIISPCSPEWGESRLIPKDETRFFWFANHIAWLIRRKFIDAIRELEAPSYMNFLYDGTNFRGYDADIELVAKAYANGYGVAITRKASFTEDSLLTDRNAAVIKTDRLDKNQEAMLAEGLAWLRRKYGFASRWNMVTYVKAFYGLFFEHNPEYLKFKL